MATTHIVDITLPPVEKHLTPLGLVRRPLRVGIVLLPILRASRSARKSPVPQLRLHILHLWCQLGTRLVRGHWRDSSRGFCAAVSYPIWIRPFADASGHEPRRRVGGRCRRRRRGVRIDDAVWIGVIGFHRGRAPRLPRFGRSVQRYLTCLTETLRQERIGRCSVARRDLSTGGDSSRSRLNVHYAFRIGRGECEEL